MPRSVMLPPFRSWLPEPVLTLDREPVRTRLIFKEDPSMPSMTRADFGHPVPVNHAEILQFINNIILHHEESVFWDNKPDDAEQWERDLIARYLSGDRSGNLAGAPEPIYR